MTHRRKLDCVLDALVGFLTLSDTLTILLIPVVLLGGYVQVLVRQTVRKCDVEEGGKSVSNATGAVSESPAATVECPTSVSGERGDKKSREP